MSRKILLAAITFVLTFAHLFYSWWVGLFLFGQAGGIRKLPTGWTEFGGITYAWTIPLQIPGTMLMRLGQYIYGDRFGGILGFLSLLAILTASVLTAYAIASLAIAFFRNDPPIFGKFYWRIVIILLGILWIPVREDWAEVYQYTVIY